MLHLCFLCQAHPLQGDECEARVSQVFLGIAIKPRINCCRPGSLQAWPKKDNIEASWALRGAEARPKVNPVVHLKAISVVEGVPKLVAREIALETAASPMQDRVITTSQILDEVRAVDSSLPGGAFPEPVSAQEPPEQVTWNAHVRVRK